MSEARVVARRASNSTILHTLARAGFVASALVHLLIGYLSIHIALHLGGEGDQSGALATVAALPFGRFILWLTTVGLFALGCWLLIQAGLGIGSSSAKRWMRSLEAAGKAAAYIVLGMTALVFASGHSTDSDKSTRHAAGDVVTLPGGRFLIAFAGVVTIAIGAHFIHKGATRHFKNDIRLPSQPAERPIVVLGIVGYVAKGVVILVVGILFLVAAATLNLTQASGLDGALQALDKLPLGQALLIVIGIGFIAYAAYTVARARLAKL